MVTLHFQRKPLKYFVCPVNIFQLEPSNLAFMQCLFIKKSQLISQNLSSQVGGVSLSSPFTSGVLGSNPAPCIKWIRFSLPTWLCGFSSDLLSWVFLPPLQLKFPLSSLHEFLASTVIILAFLGILGSCTTRINKWNEMKWAMSSFNPVLALFPQRN